MNAWEQIQHTLDTIETRLDENIPIQALADQAFLSLFYFQRLFRRLVKRPVKEYTKLRRLSKASELLCGGDRRILDIALEVGFQSHETFTRAFKSSYGITPDAYRKDPVHLNHFHKPELVLQYMLVDEDVPLITEGIVLEVTRRMLEQPRMFRGVAGEYDMETMGYAGEMGTDHLGIQWDRLHQMKSSTTGWMTDGVELGLSTTGSRAGYFRYFTGCEWQGDDPVDMDTLEMSSGAYIVCMFEAEDFTALVSSALDKALRYMFEMWIPKHQVMVEPAAIELYSSHIPETTSMELWVKVVQEN